MRASRLVTIGTLVAGLTLAHPVPARSQNVSDEIGPTITNVTFSTTSIDTTSGLQNVTVTVTGTDDLSGTNYLYVYLRTTATSQPGSQSSFGCFVSTLTSGTRLDGTFTGTCVFPQYSQSGAWFVYQTYAYDMVGNYTSLYNNGAQLGIASQTISVTAPSPPPATNTIPSLQSLTLDPPVVDTSEGNQSVTLTARITSTSGSFSYGYLGLRDPSSNQSINASFSQANRISGNAFDGTYQATAILPRYSRSGAWIWSYAQLVNTSNHYSVLFLGSKWRVQLSANLQWGDLDLHIPGDIRTDPHAGISDGTVESVGHCRANPAEFRSQPIRHRCFDQLENGNGHHCCCRRSQRVFVRVFRFREPERPAIPKRVLQLAVFECCSVLSAVQPSRKLVSELHGLVRSDWKYSIPVSQ